MMYALLKKDIVYTRHLILIGIAYIIFFAITGTEHNQSAYIVLLMYPITTVTQYDSYYKIDITLNSLPIKKYIIVLSKYIAPFLHLVILSTVYIGFSYLLKLFNMSSITFKDSVDFFPILGCLSLFCYSIILPIYFIGIPYTLLLTICIIIPVISFLTIRFFLIAIFSNYFFVLLFTGLVLLLLSLLLSIKLYKKREY